MNGPIAIKLLPEFSGWLNGLRDRVTRRRLLVRLRKVALGNLGDVRVVGEGLWEMRENFGPGWRLYFTMRGRTMVVMLHGGDKSTQQSDIQHAIRLANSLED